MDLSQSCPECQTRYTSETVICIRCGINLKTGQKLSVETADMAQDEGPALSRWERVLMFVAQWMPGFLRLRVCVASALLGVLAAVIVYLSLAIFAMGALISAFAVGALGVIAYAQALVWMICGELLLLNDGLVEFDSRNWSVFLTLLFTPLALAFAAAHYALQSS